MRMCSFCFRILGIALSWLLSQFLPFIGPIFVCCTHCCKPPFFVQKFNFRKTLHWRESNFFNPFWHKILNLECQKNSRISSNFGVKIEIMSKNKVLSKLIFFLDKNETFRTAVCCTTRNTGMKIDFDFSFLQNSKTKINHKTFLRGNWRLLH